SIVKISTAFKFGISDIDLLGFLFVTILLSIYVLVIAFKIRGVAYFPIILLLFHISSLNGAALSIFFVIADIVLLVLLNTGTIKQTEDDSTTFYTSFGPGGFSSGQSRSSSSNQSNSSNTSSSRAKRVDSDDIFDAEYNTKE
ncbi:MAG: hypothetical protein RR425_05990, partial [Erysipelotrichales bacterium]